jgi:hypothetical protein
VGHPAHRLSVARWWFIYNATRQSPHTFFSRLSITQAFPALGAGTQQIFTRTMLEWTPKRGVFEGWMGPELLQLRVDLAALQKQSASQQVQQSS